MSVTEKTGRVRSFSVAHLSQQSVAASVSAATMSIKLQTFATQMETGSASYANYSKMHPDNLTRKVDSSLPSAVKGTNLPRARGDTASAQRRPSGPVRRPLASRVMSRHTEDRPLVGQYDHGREGYLHLKVSSLRRLVRRAIMQRPGEFGRRLAHGDALFLTGEARWDYLHRVLPSPTSREERISLVFGCW